MHSYIGKRIPVYTTAAGRAFIAYSSEENFNEVWDRISTRIKKLTPSTITDKEIMYGNQKIKSHATLQVEFKDSQLLIKINLLIF